MLVMSPINVNSNIILIELWLDFCSSEISDSKAKGRFCRIDGMWFKSLSYLSAKDSGADCYLVMNMGFLISITFIVQNCNVLI